MTNPTNNLEAARLVIAKPEITPPEPIGHSVNLDNENYPVEALGKVLAPMAKALNESIQAPLGLCGQSVLMSAALVAQGRRDVEIAGSPTPVSLFALTIAESGDRKSTVNNIALAPINAFEREQIELYKEDFKAYQLKREVYKEAVKSIKNRIKGEEDKKVIEQELSKAGEPPIPPRHPTLLAGDPTIEGLIKHLKDSLPSVGIYTDEGAEFFGGHSMTNEKVKKTIAQYSKLWDGSSVDMMRSDSEVGAFKLFDRRLSVHIMTQPEITKEVFNNPLLVNQGFIPRFLICQPESTMGNRMFKEVDIKKHPAFKKYFAVLKQLLDKGLDVNESDGRLNLSTLSISTNAKELYKAYHDEVESKLTSLGEYRHVSGTAAKIAEQAVRIAGVLTCINSDDKASFIHDKEMKCGIELARYSLNQLLALTERSLITIEMENARKLLGWIAENQFSHIYSGLKTSSRPIAVRKKQDFELAMVELLNAGYIEPAGDMELNGGKRRNVYKVLHYFEPDE